MTIKILIMVLPFKSVATMPLENGCPYGEARLTIPPPARVAALIARARSLTLTP